MPVTVGDIPFQALSLAVLWLFCRTLYRYRAQAGMCLKSTVDFSPRENTLHADNKRLYDRFSGVAMALGALSAGIAVVKVAAAMTGTTVETAEAAETTRVTGEVFAGALLRMPAVAAIGIAVVCVGIALLQAWALKAAGGLTLSKKFTGELIQIKKNHLAALSMLAAPVVAVWTGVNPHRDVIAGYLFAGVAVTIAILFTAHTLRGFIKQKVSLLVWFLYLCTVEILPVCALVLAAKSV